MVGVGKNFAGLRVYWHVLLVLGRRGVWRQQTHSLDRLKMKEEQHEREIDDRRYLEGYGSKEFA